MIKKNRSDSERQISKGKVPKHAPAVDEMVSVHAKMMNFELLHEASRERKIRSTNLTQGAYTCHCKVQIFGYPEKINFS